MLLGQAHGKPKDAVEAAHQYLPFILTMCDQVSKVAPGQLQLTGPLEIVWTSTLHARGKANEVKSFTYYLLDDEAAHALWAYAVLLYNEARLLAEGEVKSSATGTADVNAKKTETKETVAVAVPIDKASARKEALRLLRVCAGLCDWVRLKQIGQFAKRGPVRAPDIETSAFQFLGALCVANAQELAIDGAIEKKSAPLLLVRWRVDDFFCRIHVFLYYCRASYVSVLHHCSRRQQQHFLASAKLLTRWILH